MSVPQQVLRIKPGEFIKDKNIAMLVIDVDYRWNKAHVMHLTPGVPKDEKFECIPVNLLERIKEKQVR